MMWCIRRGARVYSCDHADCNGRSPKSAGGMRYCVRRGKWVYSCGHTECR